MKEKKKSVNITLDASLIDLLKERAELYQIVLSRLILTYYCANI